MNLIKDESAQAGGLFMVVVGIFIAGFFYVAFGAIMNQVQVADNSIITAGNIPYSQEHHDGMDTLYKYWWSIPIFAVILYVVYGIKNALTKQPGQI